MSGRARIGWIAAAALAALYLSTSAIALVNCIGNATGAVWLPSLPEAYYGLERALYLPLRPWFAVLRRFQESTDVSFAAWTLLCRGPVAAAAAWGLWLSARGLRRPDRRDPAPG